MIHSRKKGAHIGWMLLLLLVLSMGNRFCAGKRGTGLDSGKERRREKS